MSEDISKGISRLWIGVENASDQIPAFVRNKFRDIELSAQDFFIQLNSILVLKRQVPANQRKENNPRRPDVNF